MFKPPGEIIIILIIQGLLVQAHTFVIQDCQYDVAIANVLHDPVHIYGTAFVAPEPLYLTDLLAMHNPRIVNLGRIQVARVTQVGDRRALDPMDFTQLSQRLQIPLLQAGHNQPRGF